MVLLLNVNISLGAAVSTFAVRPPECKPRPSLDRNFSKIVTLKTNKCNMHDPNANFFQKTYICDSSN